MPKKKLSPGHQATTVLAVGTIPYEWIEAIDEIGDDTTNRPQMYVHFKGKKKYPYTKFRYFINDDSHRSKLKEVEFKFI